MLCAIITPMSRHTRISFIVFACVSLYASVAALAQAPADLVKEGRKLEQDGKFDESLALFRKAVAADPKLFDAQYALGRSLDLAGDYVAGRQALQEALKLAPETNRNQVLTAIAVSYAFESKPAEAEKYYTQVFDMQMKAALFENAAGSANAIGRIYLDAGDAANAHRWYGTGYETAKKIPNLKPEQIDLWEWRWLNAQGRVAARRGQVDLARSFAAKGKAILDKGTNKDQLPFYPYLAGYIEFHAKNYPKAIEELLKGDQNDPFVLGLTAQAYERTGDQTRAREFYTKVMASPGHTINAAYSRPVARKFLQRENPPTV